MDEDALKAAVLSANNEEHQEVLHKGHDLLAEISMEIDRKNFIFAEVEEKEVIEVIKRCEQALDEFSQLVYEYIQESDVNNA